jgi:hypothetical protein
MPAIVPDKFVTATLLRQWRIGITDPEKLEEWDLRNDIGYSPRIESVESMPAQAGYDEWHVFEEPADLGRLSHDNPLRDSAKERLSRS